MRADGWGLVVPIERAFSAGSAWSRERFCGRWEQLLSASPKGRSGSQMCLVAHLGKGGGRNRERVPTSPIAQPGSAIQRHMGPVSSHRRHMLLVGECCKSLLRRRVRVHKILGGGGLIWAYRDDFFS